MFPALLLALGCSSGGLSPAVTCASVDLQADTMLQLVAVANTQARLIADQESLAVRPVEPTKFYRQGEPRRTLAQQQARFATVCTVVAEASGRFAELLPAPHGREVGAKGEALASHCTGITPTKAAAALKAGQELGAAVQALVATCREQAGAEHDPALACRASEAVIQPVLGAIEATPMQLGPLDQRREAFRRATKEVSAVEPFDGAPLEKPLRELGGLEGAFGARCSELRKTTESLLQRHPTGPELSGALEAIRDLREPCEGVPRFDVFAAATDERRATVSAHAEAMKAQVARTIEAIEAPLAACSAQ